MVEEQDLEVAQIGVIFLGGVGGGKGLDTSLLLNVTELDCNVLQSLELRFGDKRDGKLRVFVH